MDRRTILAFILCGTIVFVWMWRNYSYQKQRASEIAAREKAEEDVAKSPAPDTTAPHTTAPDTITQATTLPETPYPAEKPPSPRQADVTVPLRNNILLATYDLKHETVWTNRGACLRQARLAEFPQDLDSDEGVLLLKGLDDGPASLMLIDPNGTLPLDTRHYDVIEESPSRLVFQSTFKNGLKVTKEFLPQPNKYEIRVKIIMENTAGEPLNVSYQIVSGARVMPDNTAGVTLQAVIGSQNGPDKIKIDKHRPRQPKPGASAPGRQNRAEAPILWAGCVNRYFAAILRPDPPEGKSTLDALFSATVHFLEKTDYIKGGRGQLKPQDNVYAMLLTKRKELNPGESLTHHYTYFMGPKEQDVLAQYPTMARLLDYGMFGFISRVLLAILRFFHAIIPNYGIGIILLTVLVKLCLHPLTRKSQFAMQKMQKLQPLIREIQEKHKDDRERQSRAMMEIYKKHGNPMSGCLPLFFQFPVFIGLWRMLFYSVELRQQGFLLWINDLSRPDTLTTISGFPINILPVLMVVTWIGQQLTMPKPADPQQAQQQKMMLFMPLIFLFIMYSLASGVTLYWTTSSILGIIEQRFIKYLLRKKEERGEFEGLVPQETEKRPQHRRPRRR